MLKQLNTEITGVDDKNILLCLNTLCSTPAGTVALDRDLGLDIDFIDMPPSIAENMLAVEIIKKVRRYEKRVKVLSVKLSIDSDKKYTAKVVVNRV